MVAVVVCIGLVVGGVTCYERGGLRNRIETKYTESAHEARVFSRGCHARNNSVLDPHQYTFDAWYLTCEWTEE